MNIKKLRNNKEIINVKTNKCGYKKSNIQKYMMRIEYKFGNEDSANKINNPKYAL